MLICRHECQLDDTTDVAEKFPDRKRSLVLDGHRETGWFAQDFTLAEIRTLRARERLSYRSHKHDGQFQVPTFKEFLRVIAKANRRTGRKIGICPELKHPSHHRAHGLPLEERLVKLLQEHSYIDPSSPCIIQSFEIDSLKRLSTMTKLRLLQLFAAKDAIPADVRRIGGSTTYESMMTGKGLSEIAEYAWGIGPSKELVLPRDRKNRLLPATGLIEEAHRARLAVIVYTMRNEPRHLADDYQGNPANEYRRWASLQVDGVFTDFPDTAKAALK